MPEPEADVRLVDVSRAYGSVVAVSRLTLDVSAGEFLTLLGPSGCGKTTTLNMIAGFLQPTAGEIWLRGRRVEALPPHRRDTAMVFQQYALFPHMTVFDNIAFGLRMRHTPAAQLRSRVDEALALVGLPGLGHRLPLQLSGGQQQRVALARAIAVRPAVLLLDEPLSNLDLKLREGMRLELKRLHRELGTTTIFVTHDQTEALVLSTRIAVMNQGRIEQVGAPPEIYERPRSRFVAEFVGQTNLLRGRVVGVTGRTVVVELAGGFRVTCRADPDGDPGLRPRQEVLVSIRPEQVRTDAGPGSGAAPSPGDGVVDGRIADVVYLGGLVRYTVSLRDGVRLIVEEQHYPGRPVREAGSEVRLAFAASHCRVFAAEDE